MILFLFIYHYESHSDAQYCCESFTVWIFNVVFSHRTLYTERGEEKVNIIGASFRQNVVATIDCVFSLFFSSYFSLRRICHRVLQFWMGVITHNKLNLRLIKNWGLSYVFWTRHVCQNISAGAYWGRAESVALVQSRAPSEWLMMI